MVQKANSETLKAETRNSIFVWFVYFAVDQSAPILSIRG
jgi:hypothetical protein